jgi:hypothetical protein
LVRAQTSDGRFPASWQPRAVADGAAPPAEFPRSERDLRVTALGTLALLGDGSTMRSGPFRDAVKRAVIWLLDQRDTTGRMALQTGPEWIVDHAMAASALCEAARLSSYVLLRERIEGPVAVLVEHLRRFEGGVDAELLVWCRMCARSAAEYESWWNGRPGTAEPWDSGAAALAAQVRRLLGTAAVEGPRAGAARFLLEVLAEGRSDGARLDGLAAPFVADGWPEDVDEPLAVFYASVALFRLRCADEAGRWGAVWGRVTDRLTESLVDREDMTDELRGSWDPRGAFGREFGRVGTTAVATMTLEVYYRYSRLEAAND